MLASLLVTRQGPLAHVWLASNYERKLSKQQTLNTNLVSSTRYISECPVDASADPETITLRLSGQLLLGVVRIYSRKTKYLLDDINDVLYKLKNSFRYASGASLGSVDANLVSRHTVLSNFSRVTLPDTVTDVDLLYQEDLDLDRPDPLLSHLKVVETRDIPDIAVEVGRHREPPLDFDLDLDLDLDLDKPPERGRDAQAALPEETSLLDIGGTKDRVTMQIELGAPLETVTPAASAPSAADRAPRQRLIGAGEGTIRTLKRKLIVDSEADLEAGLPNEVLKGIQSMQRHGAAQATLTLRLTDSEKMMLIEQLAAPFGPKRRRLWSLNNELIQRSAELAAEEEPDYTYDMDVDFDELAHFTDDEHEEPETNVQSTRQVASHLRKALGNATETNFRTIVDMDMAASEPLGQKGELVSKRRDATRCFFELLVLATNECVSLHQDTDLVVKPRANLVAKFL